MIILFSLSNKYAKFFADISIQSAEVQKYKYSLQGLYSVIAAREVLSVKPIWNKQYDKITKLSKHQVKRSIRDVSTTIINHYFIDKTYCQ